MKAVRRRGSFLQVLEAMTRLHRSVDLSNIVVFLYVCENEGLSVTELAQVSRYTKATASRALRAMLESGAADALPPSIGLVRFVGNPTDRRGKSIWLTEAGARLRAQIDHAIAEALVVED